jgi:chaperonin GroES
MQVLHDYVVLQLLAEKQGGLIITAPNSGKTEPKRALVYGAGPGEFDTKGNLRPMPVKAGDVVMFNPCNYAQIRHDGCDMLVIKVAEVLAILEAA